MSLQSFAEKFAKEEGDALFQSFMEELEKAPPSKQKDTIIKNANKKRYHDIEGDLLKIELAEHLQQIQMNDLAKRVVEGDFDF